ncbi:MAG TPA: LysR family transcriptional regulator [Amphiplicatus sp.]|nr:LysR family transcriptional regulator [Amphiplicatus sp.]HRX38021.1 LysR family transcriptional regulator [Parvularculaceae bacterium]
MNIKFLETFIWLVRLKSFRATAEKLNTTQPNISSRISSLEDILRTTLYVRGSKEFQLTAAGRRIFDHAEQIVDLYLLMQREVSSAGSEQAVLRIGIIEMVTLSWLPEFVRLIRESDAIGEVDFVTETSADLIDLLRKDKIDVAFLWGPSNEPNITNEYICNYAMNWLGVPSFREGADEIDIIDVAKLPVMATREGTSGHTMVREYFASYGVDFVPGASNRISMVSYSIATAIQIVRTGLGVMALPPLMVADDLQKGVIEILPVRQQMPPAYLTACYKLPTPRLFVTHVVELAREAASNYATGVNPDHFWI